MVEGEDAAAQEKPAGGDVKDADAHSPRSRKNTSIDESSSVGKGGHIKVPVNEDYLFDVDVEHRELAPAYWLGPIYNVRRGSWFYQEGSALRPCEENLASQLEEGYLKIRPWRSPLANQTDQRATPEASEEEGKPSEGDIGANDGSKSKKHESSIPAKFELQTQRLFGTYMSSVVTYQDATTAWILTDDFLSQMSSNVYQRFAGGGHLGGTKIIRGYAEANKEKKDAKKETDAANKSDNAKVAEDELRTQSSKPKSTPVLADSNASEDDQAQPQPEPRLKTLERKMSNFVSSSSQDLAQEEAMARKRDEDEIRQDYVDEDGQDQNREIEHLLLVVSKCY